MDSNDNFSVTVYDRVGAQTLAVIDKWWNQKD